MGARAQGRGGEGVGLGLGAVVGAKAHGHLLGDFSRLAAVEADPEEPEVELFTEPRVGVGGWG